MSYKLIPNKNEREKLFAVQLQKINVEKTSSALDLLDKFEAMQDEAIRWCDNNIMSGRDYFIWGEKFYFEKEADAVMFKLRWG